MDIKLEINADTVNSEKDPYKNDIKYFEAFNVGDAVKREGFEPYNSVTAQRAYEDTKHCRNFNIETIKLESFVDIEPGRSSADGTSTQTDFNNYEISNVNKFIKSEDCMKKEPGISVNISALDDSYMNIKPDSSIKIEQEELDIKDDNQNHDEHDVLQDDLITQPNERKCHECNLHLRSKYHLRLHMKQMHPGVSPYKCTKCDYTTVKKLHLDTHIISHLGEKPYKCEYCDFRTSKPYLLNRHLKLHTGRNLFYCNTCDYKTNQKYSLIQHIRSHTGEKPFNCTVCEFTARTVHQIKVHTMKNHSGESPYLCNICGLKTADKTRLTMHMRIHTGEKPFECDLCGFRLSQKSSLVRHRKIHTAKKSEPTVKLSHSKRKKLENVCWSKMVNNFSTFQQIQFALREYKGENSTNGGKLWGENSCHVNEYFGTDFSNMPLKN